MLKCRKPILISFVLLSTVWFILNSDSLADSDEEPLFLYRGARPLALGNAFEAIADDENAFHYNPAGLAQKNGLFYILFVRPKITSDLANELQEIQDLIDTIGRITESENPMGDASLKEERQELVDRLNIAMEENLGAILDLPSIGFAIPIQAAGFKLIFGGSFYTQSVSSLWIQQRGLSWSDTIKDMLDNAIIYRISFQWAIEGSGAIEIPINMSPILDKAYIGFNLRRISRWIFTDEAQPFTLEETLNSDDFTNRYFNYEEGDSALDIASKNFKKGSGYSADLGAIASPFDGLKVALVMRNMISKINIEYESEDKVFPRNLVLSAAAKPLKILRIQPSTLDFTVAASLDNPNGDDRLGDFSIDKNRERIHLGVETILWPNNAISIATRIGNNQGFLTIGAALKLGALYLEMARYGDLQADWYVGSINLSF